MLKTGKQAQMRQSNLFFIELIIVLLFFSLSAAVILRLFAYADMREHKGRLTEDTIICAQSLAEAFSVCGSLSRTSETVFGETEVSDEKAELMLDDSLKPSNNGKILLSLSTEKSETAAGILSYLNMTFSENGEEIYSLRCASYKENKGGETVD